MKSIKKIVAVSTLAITLFGFGFNPEQVEAKGLACLLFGCKKAVVKNTDLLYGDPPDFDSLYGKVPPRPERYNPDGPSPYGWYSNLLENIMGRDIREILELNKRMYERTFESGHADDITMRRSAYTLPFGRIEKSISLGNGNIAYLFRYSAGHMGNLGTPGSTIITTDGNPTSINPLGTPITQQIPGTPAISSSDVQCTTYIVADQNGKLFYWSYKGNSDSIDECASDERRLR
jgi:hypothetical protein